MPSEETILCPLCGKEVPSNVEKCPFCSSSIDRIKLRREIDKVIERRIMRRIKAKAEEPSPTDLPSAPIPEVKITCPGCGMEIAGHEAKCTRCGIPLIDEEEMLECPECSTRFAPGVAKCPKCGVSFADEGEAPPEAPVEPARAVGHAPEPPPTPPEPVPVVQPEPELVGRGLTNGRGAINGTGLVNGTGMINGTGGPRPGPGARRRGVAVARWQFLAVLVALVIIIPAFIYMSYSDDDDGLTVDGRFGDWDDADMYSMSILTTSPLTVVEEWAVGIEGTSVFLYIKAAGDIMGTSSVESFFLFVDSDDDASTGYSAGALGADFMIELDGWNDTVQASNVFVYDSDDDAYDWSSWKSLGGVVSRLDGDRLEAMGNLQSAPSADAKFLLASQDQLYRRAASAAVPAAGGVLIVTQRLSDSAPVSGVLPASDDSPILTLEFTCDGADGTVESVLVERIGFSSMADEVEGFSIDAGEVVVRHLAADLSAVSSGELVTAYVTSDGVQTSFASVVVIGHPARAYVGAAPSSVHIDGAFGDWYGRTVSDVDAVEVANANVDVNEVGVFNTSLQASFLIGVDGEMLSGSYVPVIKGKPVPGGGDGGVIPLRKTAEDITWIYIDSDLSTSTGRLMSAESKVLGADYRLEVRGVQGAVVSAVLYSYDGSSWSLTASDVSAEVDLHRLEVGVSSAAIGGQAALDFIVETTDWRGVGDFVALDEATMHALTDGISLTVGSAYWAVDSSTTASNATAMSFQRKLFYDGANFWSLYFDGSNTVYKYSSDGGATWNSAGSVFSTAGVGKASVWYAAGTVYVVGDTWTPTNYVLVRKGVVNSGEHSINWGNEKQVWISSNPLGDKDAAICADSNGRIWVGGPSYTGFSGGADRYQLRTNQSDNVGNVESTWTDRGNLLSGSLPTVTSNLCLVPGTSASGILVWAIISSVGGVYSKTYVSGWSAGTTTIYSPGTSTENTEGTPASAVVDSNGVAHVVYGTGNAESGGSIWKPHIQYSYNVGSGWAAPISLNESASVPSPLRKTPTISLDSSTGDVYAMWIEDRSVKVKKNVSGSWEFVSISGLTSDSKDYLTSIYSAQGASLICMQWTEDPSPGDYEVNFERIPEFSDVTLPVLFVLTVFIAVYRRRSKGQDDE